MAKSGNTRIILKTSDEKYIYLANVFQSDDGSIIVSALPSIQKEGKQARLKYNGEEIIIESQKNMLPQNGKRLSYHTSGIVKYHGFQFKDRQFEPLYEIKNSNVFLSLFLLLENDICNKKLKENEVYKIIDISSCKQGVLIVFSIEPLNCTTERKENTFTIEFGLFELSISFGYDNEIKKVLTQNNSSLGYFVIDNGVPINNSPDEAEIKYKKAIYKEQDIGLLVIDKGNLTYEIVFSSPMRCRPKCRIVFDNPEHKAVLAKMGKKDATKAHFRFCVHDSKGRKLSADSFKIIKVELDAEIYEPEHVWGNDWI